MNSKKTGASSKRKNILILFSIVCFVISCAKEDKTYKIAHIENIKIIHNVKPKWGNELKIELEFIRKISELDQENKQYIFFKPFDFAQDNDRNKYVLSIDEYRIRKFDPNWVYISSFGKQGQGPGDIKTAFCLNIDSRSILYVFDHSNWRVNKYSLNGSFIESFKMPFHSYQGAILRSGNIVMAKTSPIGEKDAQPYVMAIISPEGNILKEFVLGEKYDNQDLIYYANRVTFDVDNEENIYVAFRNQNRIEKFRTDGSSLFRVTRPLNYEIHQKIIGHEAFSEPDLTYVSPFIGCDDRNRFWVTTYNSQPINKGTMGGILWESNKIDFEIYDREGILLGRVPIPLPFYRFRIYADRLYLVDPYFEMSIYEYKIVEKG